jgi:hypothetical protein
MTDNAHHCPFLNRADARCSKHHSIDQLGYAFAHCFGYYEGCGVYAELLTERRAWRGELSITGEHTTDGQPTHPRLTQLTVGSRHVNRIAGHADDVAADAAAAHQSADRSVVSHAPRV